MFSGTEAASDPNSPSAFKVPPENLVSRAISPNPCSAENWEMMISPEKPPFRSPVWGVELVTPNEGFEVCGGRNRNIPDCVITTGIEIEVVGVTRGWSMWQYRRKHGRDEVGVVCLAEDQNGACFAEVGRPSKAAHPKTRVHDKSRAKTGTQFVADRIGVYSSGLGLRSFGGVLVKDPS